MDKTSRIYVAGHRGLVGSAITRRLKYLGFKNLIKKTSQEVDLRCQAAVEELFCQEKPEYVFLAAAKVGGIGANDRRPAEFIYDNLTIETNIIHQAWRFGVKKLLFLGSSCIYPKFAPQPIMEEHLLTGKLEPTNEAYAVAKIAGIKMCQAYNKQYGTNFVSIMPTNLYGPNDNFNPESSHVLPAFIYKFHMAKSNQLPEVVLWGTGTPRREFLHCDDLADACIFLMQNYNNSQIINIGCGKDVSIRELANLVKEIVGFKGDILWDKSKPDGTPRKLLDISKISRLGWEPKISLAEGIKSTYQWFLENNCKP